jgi:hypothetical protein
MSGGMIEGSYAASFQSVQEAAERIKGKAKVHDQYLKSPCLSISFSLSLSLSFSFLSHPHIVRARYDSV